MNTLRGSAQPDAVRRVVRAWDKRADRVVIFDFNGTLSDDEAILLRLYTEMFHDHLQWTLAPADYYERLAGRSDREIVGLVVAERGGTPALARELLDECCRRYCELVEGHSPIRPATLELVQRLHGDGVPLAIVTGAMRLDVEYVLSRTPIAALFSVIVTEEDVDQGKPNPEGFLTAAQELGVNPAAGLVFEDSLAGIRAARAAGMSCIAVEGTRPRAQLEGEADAVVSELAPELFDAPPRRLRLLAGRR